MVSLRRPTPLLAALIALFVLAPAANADGPRQEHWQGTWKTTHQFGTPTLKLTQEGDEVSGVYRDNGKEIGKIWGSLSGRKFRTWSGRFKDHDKSSKGKFTVRLQSDDVSFEGTFKTCGVFVCSDPFAWTGEKK
jgi:hypothetical protein